MHHVTHASQNVGSSWAHMMVNYVTKLMVYVTKDSTHIAKFMQTKSQTVCIAIMTNDESLKDYKVIFGGVVPNFNSLFNTGHTWKNCP